MLGFPCVPGLRSEPDQQSRKCASDGVGEAATEFMQLSCGEYRSVYGEEDKENSRTQIVGAAVVLIKAGRYAKSMRYCLVIQSSGRTLRGRPAGAVAHHCIGSSLYP